MPTVEFSYIDAALASLDEGATVPFWRHFHWGMFADRTVEDDSPERYFAAAEALTEHIVVRAEVADGRRILDVGCGFGGTLDHIRARNRGCRLAGVNIDLRQLQHARRLLRAGGGGSAGGGSAGEVPFVAADGCKLPVADRSFDHLLAVECIFHFPSRKAFFREAARVLRPGGTLALSDFLVAPGSLLKMAATLRSTAPSEEPWYGHVASPLTPPGYERLARSVGLELVVDDDITAATLPTYPALRRLAGGRDGPGGLQTIDGLEALATEGGWQYHVLAFRRREP